MAKISGVNRIVVESFPKDVQQWIPKLLSPLNVFLSATVFALTGNLDFNDNFLGQQQDLDFTYQGPQTFPSFLITMKATPAQIVVCQAFENVKTPVGISVAWQTNQNNQIELSDITKIYNGQASALVPGARYQITLRIFP